MMPFHNIFYEWYAAQTSKKVRAVWAMKAANGKRSNFMPNAQEAIIDENTWLRVQELRKNKRRPTATGKTSLFSGLVFCADCGSKLHFCAAKSLKANQEFFRCANYKSGRGECTIHYIRNVALEQKEKSWPNSNGRAWIFDFCWQDSGSTPVCSISTKERTRSWTVSVARRSRKNHPQTENAKKKITAAMWNTCIAAVIRKPGNVPSVR